MEGFQVEETQNFEEPYWAISIMRREGMRGGEVRPWGATMRARKFCGVIFWFSVEECWDQTHVEEARQRTEGMVLAPLESTLGDHPSPTLIYCWASREKAQRRRGKGGGGAREGVACLLQWLCRLCFSWAQQRKINHSSNGRGQGWPCDCLIRGKITPQVWLPDPWGSSPTASEQTGISETLPRVKRGETEQPASPPSSVFSYRTEKPDNEGFRRRERNGLLRFDTQFHFCRGSLTTSR